MSRGKKKNKPQDGQPAEAAIEQPSETTEQAVEQPAEPTPEERIAELEDKNLRLMAELRNVNQRAQRERQEALRYAEADFARDLLVILDDLERTTESAQAAKDVAAVAEGVRIVHEHFLKVLGDHGITPIEATDQPFDPHLHEALMQQPSEDHPSGTVMQELARGYKMHDRVIRSTKVIVSSGAPNKPGEKQPEDEQKED